MKNAVYQFLMKFLIESNALQVEFPFKESIVVRGAMGTFPAGITGHHTIEELAWELRAEPGVGKGVCFSTELTMLQMHYVINSDNCEKT